MAELKPTPLRKEEPSKQRYLLFDSGCHECSEIARLIEYEAGDWLTARSLRDPSIQSLLSEVSPDWNWEPTLLEINGARSRAYTGLAMKVRVAAGLGPKRAVRVARMAGQSQTYEAELKETLSGTTLEFRPIGRGEALKALAALGIAALVPNALLPAEAKAKPANAAKDSPKFTITELSKKRLRKVAEKIRNREDASLLWNELVQRGFTPEVDNGGGSVVVPLARPYDRRLAGRKMLVAQIPFRGPADQRAILYFSRIGNRVDISVASYEAEAGTIAGSEIGVLALVDGQVVSETVQNPYANQSSSSEPVFTAQVSRNCRICRRVFNVVFDIGCGAAVGTICATACAFFSGPAAVACGLTICPVVVGLVCNLGVARPDDACIRFCP